MRADRFESQVPVLTYDWLALHGYTLTRPWLWWQLITYGFSHAQGVSHVLFNMLALFFLGRDVEALYGRWEFLRVYLAMLLFGGLVWSLLNLAAGGSPQNTVLGASGAVAGVVVLFALHFPRRTLLLFFVLPVPAWFVGVLVVFFDMLGAMQMAGSGDVAYTVHLAGAAFALLYSKLGWNFGRLGSSLFGGLSSLGKPRLKVHRPDDEDGPRQSGGDDNLSREVDRILEKISREGEASLTRRERKTLQDAARKYQQRRD
jgi:membrane associated rhomboid family serine protease